MTVDQDSIKSVAGKVWIPLRMEDLEPDTRQKFLNALDKVPDLPLSVGKVIETADNAESSLEDLAGLISSDPGLVSNILKVVNSSYYSLRNKTDNLHLAIVLLGFKEVRKIAVHSFFRRLIIDSQVHRRLTRQLWDHSYLVSVCAESLCPPDDQQKRGLLLTLGLLHDIGKFTLFSLAQGMKSGANHTEAAKIQAETKYTMEREEQVFRINHPLVGALMAEKWNLSERFISVLQRHHYPSFNGVNEIPREHLQDIAAVCFADLLVNRYQGAEELPTPHPLFFEIAGFEPPLDRLLTEERLQVLEKARNFLSVLQ